MGDEQISRDAVSEARRVIFSERLLIRQSVNCSLKAEDCSHCQRGPEGIKSAGGAGSRVLVLLNLLIFAGFPLGLELHGHRKRFRSDGKEHHAQRCENPSQNKDRS